MKQVVLLFLTVLLLSNPLVASPYAAEAIIPDDMRETAQKAADALKNKQYDKAESLYHAIIKAYPDCLYAWSNLGVVHFQQDELAEAVEAFGEAVRINPKDAFARIHLGLTYLQLNRTQDAVDTLEKAVRLAPKSARAHHLLGDAYDRAGRHYEAQNELNKAMALKGPAQ